MKGPEGPAKDLLEGSRGPAKGFRKQGRDVGGSAIEKNAIPVGRWQ